MTIFDKLAMLDRYGFRFSSRQSFAEFSAQAARECFQTIPGRFAVWEWDGDVDAFAVVGDDPEELINLAVDLAEDLAEHEPAA